MSVEALRRLFLLPTPGVRKVGASPAGEEAACSAALQGSVAAWDLLIGRYQRRVVVSLLAQGVRLERAEELAQDAWARLIQLQREGRLTRLELPGLVLAQARFLFLESLRERSPSTLSLPQSEEARQVRDPAPSAEDRLVDADQLQWARKLAEGFSRNTRAVMEAVYADPGASHREIAARVGLSVQRVRQILCEVRGKVRAGLERER